MAYWFYSFLIGAVAVIQGGVNRKITTEWGLSGAIFLNSILVLLVAGLFVWVCQAYPSYFPQNFTAKFNSSTYRWWYLLPSICGFIIICAIPAFIPKIGASSVFLCMVIGQLIFSLLWDLKFENIAISSQKIIGISIAIIGLVVSYWKK